MSSPLSRSLDHWRAGWLAGAEEGKVVGIFLTHSPSVSPSVLYGNVLSRTPNIEAPAKTLLEGGVGVNAKASETYEVFLPFFTVCSSLGD
jgi:hypothetical protein